MITYKKGEEVMPTKVKTKKKVRGKFTVSNLYGLHTRPSTQIARCALTFRSQIWLTDGKMQINAKSIFGILMLSARRGTNIQVIAHGEDAEDAVQALLHLANEQFGVEY